MPGASFAPGISAVPVNVMITKLFILAKEIRAIRTKSLR
jgi:hypothetical protein